MNTYKVTLGNIEERPGHRHDCAQIELAVHVRAPTAAGALAAVVEMAKAPLEVTGRGCAWPMTLVLTRQHLGARSVRVEEVLS